MKKMAPKKTPMKLTPASALRIRKEAQRIMGPKGDKDSAAGAAN